MSQQALLKKIETLPPEAQQQVVEFVTFLETRYRIFKRNAPAGELKDEEFVGLWRNRKDMNDSNLWVRDMRIREWRIPVGE